MTPLAALRYALELDAAAILHASGFEDDPWQCGILRTLFPNGIAPTWSKPELPTKAAILGARQIAGKSTTIAAAHVLQCLQPDSPTYLGGPSEDQSKEVLSKARVIVKRLGFVGTLIDPRKVDQTTIMVWRNGSFIRALSRNETTGQGKTARLLSVTEAALASDELIDGLRPSLATTNGTLIQESRPFGQRGQFHGLFRLDDKGYPKNLGGPHPGRIAGWTTFARPYSMCTRATKEFLEGERLHGALYFDEQYACRFHPAVGSLIPADLINAACVTGIRPAYPDSEWVRQDDELPQEDDELALDGPIVWRH